MLSETILKLRSLLLLAILSDTVSASAGLSRLMTVGWVEPSRVEVESATMCRLLNQRQVSQEQTEKQRKREKKNKVTDPIPHNQGEGEVVK